MKKRYEDVSAVILAGGRSSRMGKNKAQLFWNGTTLIEHQVKKLRELGIDDIMISGYPERIEGTRFVPDKYPLKGPLGGIHAGLCAAKKPCCLVTPVDTPLVPTRVLSELIDAHTVGESSITVLAHGEELEPLMAVYECSLSCLAEQILMTDDTSVRVLFRCAGIAEYRYSGDERLLCDCNTPEDFNRAALRSFGNI